MAATPSGRLIQWGVFILVLAGVGVLVVLGMRPAVLEVVHPRTGEIRESFSEPARTRHRLSHVNERAL